MNKQAIKPPTTNTKAPVHQVQLGTIRAAIWKNDTESGVRYNVTVERIYKDKDEWKSTGSFGRDDLLVLAKAVDQAHTWIFAQPRPEKPEAK